jgi:anti-sigma regulatory factor (Ser/Thr protein kinase)
VNAIIHGNLEVSSALKEESWEQFEALVQEREASPEFGEKQVIVRCQITLEQIRFEVEDQGQGFDARDWQTSHPGNILALDECELLMALSKSGRGLLLITSFMDNVFWNDAGNCITMVKNLQI